jgi:hypothetical protein
LRKKAAEILSAISVNTSYKSSWRNENYKSFGLNLEFQNTGNKHKNYEILNLIGYGLAKFDTAFTRQFNCKTKAAFYQEMVKLGIGETAGTIKNRQDLFDPFFPNDRKGWWQKGNAYIHRKHFIDSLFGAYDVKSFASIVKIYLKHHFNFEDSMLIEVSPIIKSKFKQLQVTGQEAELYFKGNYHQIEVFQGGLLEDARLLGDGYDFQIQIESKYFLVDVKGIRSTYGAFRMTKKEFTRAAEYKNDYGLVIVSNLEDIPKMTTIFDPVKNVVLEKRLKAQEQISYHSKPVKW